MPKQLQDTKTIARATRILTDKKQTGDKRIDPKRHRDQGYPYTERYITSAKDRDQRVAIAGEQQTPIH